MGKKSKWLKWKIGGSLIVSLAAVFQIAKTDPAFGQAVQAAQKTDDSFDNDGDSQGYLPQLPDEAEAAKEHKDEELENEMSQAPVETVLAPVVTTTQKTAQTHAEASQSVETTPVKKSVTAQKQPSKNSVPKAASNSKLAKREGKQSVSAKTETTPSPIQKPPASVDLPAVQQPPADIPVARPVESAAVTPVENNSQTEVQTEESNTTQEEVKPSEKKKSQTRSRHS
ncbi:hypothetical protein [Brevibacillus reuszeri]|uniref:hypothetical protein n=1 Tax=Brevibacillus reuszeri TaxID=54915 RepID=UPI00289E5CB2|nr:hypothetical protein [Brevibacillus reuszeri]